jgi:hypothetical protein
MVLGTPSFPYHTILFGSDETLVFDLRLTYLRTNKLSAFKRVLSPGDAQFLEQYNTAANPQLHHFNSSASVR